MILIVSWPQKPWLFQCKCTRTAREKTQSTPKLLVHCLLYLFCLCGAVCGLSFSLASEARAFPMQMPRNSAGKNKSIPQLIFQCLIFICCVCVALCVVFVFYGSQRPGLFQCECPGTAREKSRSTSKLMFRYLISLFVCLCGALCGF